jgi:hypothetical protein
MMNSATLRTLTMGAVASVSNALTTHGQEWGAPLQTPSRGSAIERVPETQAPQDIAAKPSELAPTDFASGPIAYIGPEALKAKLTTFANDTLAEMAQSWCDQPIEIPVTPLRITLAPEGASGQAVMEFQGGKMVAASVTANADGDRMSYVIRHEMTHLVLRARCGRDLPRWFDEGCASSAEGQNTLDRFRRDLVTNYLINNRGISFQEMFMRVDPPTGDITMPFYAQATTLVEFLLERAPGQSLREKRHYLVNFISSVVRDGASMEAYHTNVRAYFGFPRVSALQNAWLEWLARAR